MKRSAAPRANVKRATHTADRRPRRQSARAWAPPDDPNIAAAGFLHDMALLQRTERSRFGYKRAAKMVAAGVGPSGRELIAEGTRRSPSGIRASASRTILTACRSPAG